LLSTGGCGVKFDRFMLLDFSKFGIGAKAEDVVGSLPGDLPASSFQGFVNFPVARDVVIAAEPVPFCRGKIHWTEALAISVLVYLFIIQSIGLSYLFLVMISCQ